MQHNVVRVCADMLGKVLAEKLAAVTVALGGLEGGVRGALS
jgi:hypothetical protein